MRNASRFRPSPALVISMIALFVSISGVAWAAATIGTDDIKNGAVTADKLHSNAVTNPKIKNAAVNGAKLQNNAVTNPKIALGAVSSSKLQNNAVTNPKIGLGAVSAQKLQNNAVTNAKLQDNAVSSGKIQDNAVNGAKIASGSVGTDELGAVVTRTNSISVPANSARQVSKSCDPGELALSAGANWNGAATVGPVLQAATYVSGTPEPTTGTAAGRNNGGGARTLTVIVSCLQP